MTKSQEHLGDLADHTLVFFKAAADAARAQLEESREHSADAFAAVNTLTAQRAVDALAGIGEETRRELRQLSAEPAIARIVVRDEANREMVYFISRAGTLPGLGGAGAMASYRSPIGRLAAVPVGEEREVPTPKGPRSYEVMERAALHPDRRAGVWDSKNTVVQGHGFGPLTVVSLRALLDAVPPGEEVDLLDAMLTEDSAASNVIEGLRRDAVMKMGLRDQPLLDQYQDEIFRLPINTHLVILGPPGTGKTTTLIKRLGLKLDQAYLEPEERALVQASVVGPDEHPQSWLMFTPTELLKQYVKEAFNREGIAASDLRIQTWSDFRRDIARNQLGILRTAAGTGSFVLKEDLETLLPPILDQQTEWFNDFDNWQVRAFWEELATNAEALSRNPDKSVSRLGTRLGDLAVGVHRDNAAGRFIEIGTASDELQPLLARLKSDTDGKIRGAFSAQLREHPQLLQELVEFVAALENAEEDSDDPDAEVDEEEEPQRPVRQARELAFDAYTKAVRAYARALAGRRTLGRQTRNGRIIEWLGARLLPGEELRTIGASLQVQAAARRFSNPLRRYVFGVPARYRRYRREQQAEGRWYRSEGFSSSDLAPLEVDAILLAILQSARGLLGDRRVASSLDESRFASLATVRSLLRNQIAVDEATDFSPLQLACMAALCDAATSSFLACGDFNQRITKWGSRSIKDLRWVLPDIDIRSINTSYRHSRQLGDLARRIALADGADAPGALLPEHVNNEGVPAILAVGMKTREVLVAWLAQRIAEIERFTGGMPSIAVLVNDEEDVVPLAEALDSALADGNVRCVACSGGRSVGQDNDVRVFAVEHIKGLEFEAVFIVGLDVLAARSPDLFDKYLYVGTTRAAYFLGLTTVGDALPSKLAPLADAFGEKWA